MHQLAQWGHDRSPFKSKDVKYIIWSLSIFLLEFTALKHLVLGTLIADQLDSRALFCELLQASEKKTHLFWTKISQRRQNKPSLSYWITLYICLN